MTKALSSKLSFQTPIGWLTIYGSGAGIHAIDFEDEDLGSDTDLPECVLEAKRQLDAYFEGKLREFNLKLAPKGTEFQNAAWNLLLAIPFGQTRSYMDQARALQNEKAIRAVGAANGRNPIAVVVPCHRVIGSNGSLTGYAGGLWRKEWLLKHERNLTYGTQGSLFE